MTHICVGKLTIIGSDNGLSPGRRQAIIWTNAGILLIGPLETNFSEILSEIQSFSFKKMYLEMSSGKWRPCCLGLNVLNRDRHTTIVLAPQSEDKSSNIYDLYNSQNASVYCEYYRENTPRFNETRLYFYTDHIHAVLNVKVSSNL